MRSAKFNNYDRVKLQNIIIIMNNIMRNSQRMPIHYSPSMSVVHMYVFVTNTNTRASCCPNIMQTLNIAGAQSVSWNYELNVHQKDFWLAVARSCWLLIDTTHRFVNWIIWIIMQPVIMHACENLTRCSQFRMRIEIAIRVIHNSTAHIALQLHDYIDSSRRIVCMHRIDEWSALCANLDIPMRCTAFRVSHVRSRCTHKANVHARNDRK